MAEFYYDFGSPNAYLAYRVLPGIEARTGTTFTYVPVLLGGLFKLTGNQAPMVAFAGVPKKLAYEHREMERFIARHDLAAFRMNPHFPVNTLSLMRGAVAAEYLGCAPAYVEAMFSGMWEDGKKLDDPSVMREVLDASALPTDTLVSRMGEQDVKDRLAANTAQAHAQGAFGIPSFIVGGELYFGKDKMRDIEDVLMAGRA